MTKGRPEILFPLFAEITTLDGVGPKLAKLFEKLDLTRPRDVLFHLPERAVDRRPAPDSSEARHGEILTTILTPARHRAPSRRGAPWHVDAQDTAGNPVTLVYFRAGRDMLADLLTIGAPRLVSGKVEFWNDRVQLIQPEHVIALDENGDPVEPLPAFEPVYPLTQGVTQRVLHKAARSALARAPEPPEWIDTGLLRRRKWPAWRAALEAAHAPASEEELAAAAPARERLAYDEMLSHQLALSLARASMRKTKGRPSHGDGRLQGKVRGALPFDLTAAQEKAVGEVHADMAATDRMNRLLQGDVGSGKTVVALLSMLAAVEAGGQAALMAPTEILARQHLESLAPMLAATGIEPVLLTGRDKGKAREAKLMAIMDGAPVVLGTHALFQKDVAFRDLRLAVIDEQHRFGVRQRMDLSAKGLKPDVLVMTATPIPRSLALANYGDMDVSVLDEKPPGRKPVTTALISSEKMDQVVERLAKALWEGRRAYWVCPLVEESDTKDLAAAEARARELRDRLGPALAPMVALVHGRMPPAEKDSAMAAFISGEARLLVATTVIEVGVNVPEATIMVIEGADSFGLAQLHQLRGRVGRGGDASTCLLMYDPPLTENARARLSVMRETEDGFVIAEEDLRLRGAGDLLGVQQSGAVKFRVADIETQAELMEIAQDEARLDVARMEAEGESFWGSERGQALRALLYLMERDAAIRLLGVG